MVKTLEWSFLEFIDEDGVAPFSSVWMMQQPEEAQAAIDTRILIMKSLDRPQWSQKWMSSYTGYVKLFELRIPHNKVQYRPLGCYGPAQREFTILIGAIERNSRIPKSTLNVAMSRMQLVLNDRRWVREYNFDTAQSLEETSG